jgi:hypothetical protein
MLHTSDNHVLTALFDSSSELRPFANSNIKDIPAHGSIIYTVFLDKSEFIYVGIGGLSGKSVIDRNPRSRIRQHTQGTRSGDQFCIYIQDFYVLPTLLGQPYTPAKGHLDRLTKEFIQTRLSYRYAVIQSDDSNKVVRRIERELQSGQHGHAIPTLNGMTK